MLGIVTPKQIGKAMSIAAACSSLRTEATFVCRPSIAVAAFPVWRAAHVRRIRQWFPKDQGLAKGAQTSPAPQINRNPPGSTAEELRTSAHEPAMSHGEALARHGGTDGKFRQACD
jgi:hypothetical protein